MVSLLLQAKVFLFILAALIVLVDILHVVSVFRLKNGKLVSSDKSLWIFGVAISYILTMLICGF